MAKERNGFQGTDKINPTVSYCSEGRNACFGVAFISEVFKILTFKMLSHPELEAYTIEPLALFVTLHENFEDNVGNKLRITSGLPSVNVSQEPQEGALYKEMASLSFLSL